MTQPDVIWGAVLAVGALVELWALRNAQPGDTLSERVRVWFRTHTRPGRAAFAVAWLGFSAWFLVHILS
ncbi:hypothetical protein N4G70_17190 [Streptomyces sp. ASQP_92]|uniref:hypothetical protein n=1 Tax=Streptomyces sp. ASQP_92 TaxID=2979116 RepID=UPI0021BE5EB3|nr:hypothetical protein [Streptomyces sp. ASQP_92]MCT9090577.1 hypothetical protein [Streptomyces sp. ASQP_92]